MNRSVLIFTLTILSLTIGVSSRQAVEPTSFHHVHLNSTDPSTAAGFYTRIFSNTSKTEIAGITAIRSEDIHLLFDRVEKVPTVSPDSAIWHFGWGSTDMESDYQSLHEKGIAFQTPLTRLGSGLQFAYLKAPDGALVEINTSNTRAFTHVHLYSDAPLCAADWYVKNLGAASRSRRTGPCEVPFAEPSEPLGVIRSPATTVRFDEISLIIYPRQRPGPLVSPRGHAVDHIAFTVRDFEGTLDRLTGSGIRIIEKTYLFGNSRTRAAMIEGPDLIAIELIEKE